MTPRMVPLNHPNLLLADAKTYCQAILSKYPSQAADFQNVHLSQFGTTARFSLPRNIQAEQERVARIARLRDPLKIIYYVIRFLAVLMINFVGRWARTYKGFSNQRGNRSALRAAQSVETDVTVAVMANVGLEDQPCLSASSARNDAPYASKIADFVNPLVANNRTPFFDRLFLHRNLPFGATQRGASTPPLLSF